MAHIDVTGNEVVIYDNQDDEVLRLPTADPTVIANLTHSVGTGNGALVDVGGAFSQGTLNDNFRDLSDKINALLNELRSRGIIG